MFLVVKCAEQSRDDILPHRGVDPAGKLYALRGQVVQPGLPALVKRMDGDTVPAQAGAGVGRAFEHDEPAACSGDRILTLQSWLSIAGSRYSPDAQINWKRL